MATDANAEVSHAPVWDARAPLPTDVDVLVVGLGPVGATIANLLGIYGVRALVVDKSPEIFMAPRAIALDNEALRVLQLAGLEDGDFDKIAIPFVRMTSPYHGEFGRINTLGEIDGHPKLVTFYQPQLEAVLRKRLARHPTIQTALGVTLTGLTETDGVTATMDLGAGQKASLTARYVIGADGASSIARELIGQQFEGETYGEDWLVVDATRPSRTIDHVEFMCDHRRPVPHMPAPGGRERWEFMMLPNEMRAEMESDARVGQLLAPWGKSADMAIERKAVYRFQARTAKAFSKGRIFLAGDAAHVTPPFAGQGLVAGLRDAANLSWKIAWVLHGRASEAILASYDVERRPHAKAMIDLAKFMGRLIMPRSPVKAFLIHGLMRLLRLTPSMRRYFDDLGIKPKNAFAKGLFAPGRSGAKLVRGGQLPQGWVRDREGRIRLSDDTLGATLTLIGFATDAEAALSAETMRAFAARGGKVVQFAHRGQALHLREDAHYEDLEGVFMPGAAPFGWAAVVRPDRTVLHDGPAADADRLVRECVALLGAPATVAQPAFSV
ncbi:MAG: bifunctional 3-(3-hydroxy-phenyl)propionate/3-hydroxycinnamic acid hydroxylase [Beijerinckiaceae bacterium]